MQAIILAAGMGKRLKELTQHATKCMVEVNGIPMINRALSQLDQLGLKRIVVVVGYEGEKLQEHIDALNIHTKIEYVYNTIYDKTNNIYSLYLAKDYLLQDDTLLLESDLVFEEAVLRRLVDDPYPSLALVAKFESWMDGTVVTIDEDNQITNFFAKKDFHFEDTSDYYKTVNIYKFSKNFSTTHYVPFLDAYCKALGHNEYYEQVLKVISMLDKPELKAAVLDKSAVWYEIDDVQDLDIAESLFAEGRDRLSRFQHRYGGYWRYPDLLDFCYLVNPYFPNQKLLSEMRTNFDILISQYPSGMDVCSLLAAKCFGLRKTNVVVGNGAAELIKSLVENTEGRLGVIYPTFEEYPNRATADRLVMFLPQYPDYRYTVDDLMAFYGQKENHVETLIVVNPDNPTGNFIRKEDLLRLLDWCETHKVTFVLDESFVDFADDEDASMLMSDIIVNHENLIVVKSISKSYGVPGLRLGILASGNQALISKLKKDVSIWNINSFGEFFLQIYEKYASGYRQSLVRIKETRTEMIAQLQTLPHLRVMPSQANYVMCELQDAISSTDLTEKLLNEHNIFIKDLSTKRGFESKQFIRLAVRSSEDNQKLIEAMKTYL